MRSEEINLQKSASKMAGDHVIHCISLTIENQLENDSDFFGQTIDLLEESRQKDESDGDEYTQEPGDREIYEYWAVTHWLYDRLKDHGEVVFPFFDFHVWGRQTTGQNIYMDSVIREITQNSSYYSTIDVHNTTDE